jgi:hypothetical protein
MVDKMSKTFSLVVNFASRDEVENFAKMFLSSDVSLYEADALDPEYSGRPCANSFVLRRKGHKPDSMEV